MEYFEAAGRRVAVAVSGPGGGMPLVLLHGGGSDSSSWAGVAPAFAAAHRVYAVDLRGFGASERGGPYGFEPMRDDVLGLLDVIGAGPVDLVGHSMGGTVAWLVAQELAVGNQLDRLAHLVVEDSPPPRKGASRLQLGERPAEVPFDWDALVAVVAGLNDPDPRWWDRLGSVTVPTLLLAGGSSSHVPQHLYPEMVALLPHAQLLEIPVGHNIHRDAPDQFLAAVLPFLR
jgi:pimeloyl-ACP methyl ester carboxylesterase